MARLLCDNLDLTDIQLSPFLEESEANPLVDCSKIASINLNHWKNEIV